jgi:hypothetical protein
MMEGLPCDCVELSALREAELDPLVDSLASLNLSSFKYVSVHAPSQLHSMTERHLVDRLCVVAQRKLPIVLHPDVIQNHDNWIGFGDVLCIENMDKRKPIGRTAAELKTIFRRLPEATLCFDVGHARQVDPTMSQAVEILSAFGGRLRQMHVSEVNAQNKHEPLSMAAIHAFRKVAHLIPEHVPVILETPVSSGEMLAEMAEARFALSGGLPRTVAARAGPSANSGS